MINEIVRVGGGKVRMAIREISSLVRMHELGVGLDKSLERVGRLEYGFGGLLRGQGEVRMWNRDQSGFERDLVRFKGRIEGVLERNRKALGREGFTPDFGEAGGAARKFIKKMAETVSNLEKQYDCEMENFEKIVTSTNVESDVIAALKERIEMPVLANIEKEFRLKQEAYTLKLNLKDTFSHPPSRHTAYSKIQSKVDTGRNNTQMSKHQPKYSFRKVIAPEIPEANHEEPELTFQKIKTPDKSIPECPDGESDQQVTESRHSDSIQEEGSPSLDLQIMKGKKDDTVSSKSGGNRSVSRCGWTNAEIEPTVTMDAGPKNPIPVSATFLANRKLSEVGCSN